VRKVNGDGEGEEIGRISVTAAAHPPPPSLLPPLPPLFLFLRPILTAQRTYTRAGKTELPIWVNGSQENRFSDQHQNHLKISPQVNFDILNSIFCNKSL
jgi:hypothetical protein